MLHKLIPEESLLYGINGPSFFSSSVLPETNCCENLPTLISYASIGTWPINPPSLAHWSPEKFLVWRAARVVVKNCGPLIEAPCVPRIREFEELQIQMMAEFVTKRAQESSE